MDTSNRPKNKKGRSLNSWQKEWDGHIETGQRTKSLIKDGLHWTKCQYRTAKYYLIPVLKSKSAHDFCIYCRKVNTVEHIFIRCMRWKAKRNRSHRTGANYDIINIMIRHPDSRAAVDSMVREIIERNKRDEKEA